VRPSIIAIKPQEPLASVWRYYAVIAWIIHRSEEVRNLRCDVTYVSKKSPVLYVKESKSYPLGSRGSLPVYPHYRQ
jgi:hypothetical protein